MQINYINKLKISQIITQKKILLIKYIITICIFNFLKKINLIKEAMKNIFDFF